MISVWPSEMWPRSTQDQIFKMDFYKFNTLFFIAESNRTLQNIITKNYVGKKVKKRAN